MHIEIMPMEIEDVDEVYAIEKECFSNPWSKRIFLTEVKQNLLGYSFAYVAKEIEKQNEKIINSKVVGYTVFWKFGDEIHIGNLAVKKEYRRRGIGSLLLQKVLEFARELKSTYVTLEVRQSNYAAINLYKRFGFKVIGVRKGYYTNPTEDALIMLKNDM